MLKIILLFKKEKVFLVFFLLLFSLAGYLRVNYFALEAQTPLWTKITLAYTYPVYFPINSFFKQLTFPLMGELAGSIVSYTVPALIILVYLILGVNLLYEIGGRIKKILIKSKK